MSEAALRRLDAAALRAWPLPQPRGDGDKRTRGRVVIVAGTRETPGAALLSARAAFRAGAGRVLVATVESCAAAVGVALPELRVIALRETPEGAPDPAEAARIASFAGAADALLLGPGWLDEEAGSALAAALLDPFADVPTILDAAAMRAATQPRERRAPLLVTPHAGEMAHLCGVDAEAIEADAPARARDAAQRWQAIVALKGARTILAEPDGPAWLHEDGDVGLATAGSGDVLAGVIAGLAARGAALAQAAAWGIALHARAGARRARRTGHLGYFASELAGEVPALLEALAGEGEASTGSDARAPT